MCIKPYKLLTVKAWKTQNHYKATWLQNKFFFRGKNVSQGCRTRRSTTFRQGPHGQALVALAGWTHTKIG